MNTVGSGGGRGGYERRQRVGVRMDIIGEKLLGRIGRVCNLHQKFRCTFRSVGGHSFEGDTERFESAKGDM